MYRKRRYHNSHIALEYRQYVIHLILTGLKTTSPHPVGFFQFEIIIDNKKREKNLPFLTIIRWIHIFTMVSKQGWGTERVT